MPSHVDVLIERLKGFDEVTIVELLNLSTEDLVERFRDRILERQDYLYGEVEEFAVDDEDYDDFDGFQVEDYDEGDE